MSPPSGGPGKVQKDYSCRCGKKDTMKRILSNCFLAMKRYTWRHNEVLKVMAEVGEREGVCAE